MAWYSKLDSFFRESNMKNYRKQRAKSDAELASYEREKQYRASVSACANCTYFSYNWSSIDHPYTCLKHNIDFTHSEIDNDVHYKSTCDHYKRKGE